MCPVKTTNPLKLALSQRWLSDGSGSLLGGDFRKESACLIKMDRLLFFLLFSLGTQMSRATEEQLPSYKYEDKSHT